MSGHTPTAVQYGVGPIGSRIARAAHDTGFEFVGAVDIDPEKVGADLGDVAGFDESVGVEVTDDAARALAADPDVVFHATVSAADRALPQLTEVVEAGANVVSTTEELAYPAWAAPDVAAELDRAAADNGVTVLGAGINPGFVMDALPAFLSTPMASVDRVTVERVQDAGTRREPLQRKVGAGVSVETFEAEIATEAGHVGSTESVAMVSEALGFDVDRIEESIEPVVADERIETEYFTVEPGEVAGIRQVAHGHRRDGEDPPVSLDLQMYVGADEPRDVVHFEGDPGVSVTVEGGYHGDVSTAAVVANVAPTVIDADPGLASMIDLLPSFTRQAYR
jgi:4-hydroxy-tetrahydrodipicolinate reductase